MAAAACRSGRTAQGRRCWVRERDPSGYRPPAEAINSDDLNSVTRSESLAVDEQVVQCFEFAVFIPAYEDLRGLQIGVQDAYRPTRANLVECNTRRR